MVGVQVRDEQRIDLAQLHAGLHQALRGAAAAVDQQVLAAGLHQHAGTEALHDRRRAAGAEQGDAELVGRKRLSHCGYLGQGDAGSDGQPRDEARGHDGAFASTLSGATFQTSVSTVPEARITLASGQNIASSCCSVSICAALAAVAHVDRQRDRRKRHSDVLSERDAAAIEVDVGMDAHAVQLDAVLVRNLVTDDAGAADQRSDQGLSRV